MSLLLYIETNFLISHAAGRDAATESLVSDPSLGLRLVIPGVCFMEAFSTLEGESGRHNRLIASLQSEIRQVERNVVSPNARALVNHLQRALVEARAILNDYSDRLYRLIGSLSSMAEIIETTSDVLRFSLGNELIDDPTDNLILSAILADAGSRPSEAKILLTENRKCFHDNPDAGTAIQHAGVKNFRRCLEMPGMAEVATRIIT